MIKLILAMDKNGGIGAKNHLPWYLPADLQYFKKVTANHTIVMGRKTMESLGRPLPNRHNIVLTRDPEPVWVPERISVYSNIEAVVKDYDNIFVIGGANIYKQFETMADRLYVTHIHEEFECDTHVSIDWEIWDKRYSVQGKTDKINIYPHTFSVYDKKQIGER